jgi:YegS/Rv2252/BmrU family lipid kinase
MPPARSVLAVFNPVTGQHTSQSVIEPLQEEATERGIDLQVEVTRYAGHATDIARAAVDHIDTVIAIGGDGTVSEVVEGVANTQLPVGIIPAGSTNMIAKDLRIPRDFRAAARIALGDGRPIAIDIARIGSKTILHMAGAGYDAAIMRDTSSRWKRRVGWVAYLPSGIRNLTYPSFPFVATIDGHRHTGDARVVLVAIGGSIIHPRFKVGEDIDRTDGLLDILVYNPPNVLGVLNCFGWIALGQPHRCRWLSHWRGRTVSLHSDRPVPVEVDGDYAGELPIEVIMLDAPVRVLAPERRRRLLHP